MIYELLHMMAGTTTSAPIFIGIWDRQALLYFTFYGIL